MASQQPMPGRSGVERFRETFGDTNTPEITRKITACVSCRKQKIKCHRRNPQEPCNRCKKRGLPCTVNRSLQMVLEDGLLWKDKLADKVQKLSEAMNLVAEKLSLPGALISLDDEEREMISSIISKESHSNTSTPAAQVDEPTPPQSWSDATEADFTPASIPASCVPRVTNPNETSVLDVVAKQEPDLIDSRIISLDQAEELFDTYRGRLDHYLYRIIGDIDTLATVRKHSSLLTAAICTVASLHHPSPDMPYDKCFREFMRISSTRMFSGRNNLYDIQAFVIGAFWLKEISWNLIGAAVRIATELQLHRAILKIEDGGESEYERARLFYLVYVCDHHFSIPYGRPPLTGEYEAVCSTERFMESTYVVEDDARLISQVKIWSITSQVFATFGTDSSRPTPTSMIGQLHRYKIALDTWRADWSEKFNRSVHVGNYPQKGVGLHYHFAKLYLCSHAFRGISKSSDVTYRMPPEMVEIAETGVASAMNIIRTVNTDTELHSFLDGLPLYFDTMIAFAAVFLLKISTEYSGIIRVDTDEALSLVHQNMVVLEKVGSKMKPNRLLTQIGAGIRELVERCRLPGEHSVSNPKESEIYSTNMDMMPHPSVLVPPWDDHMSWTPGGISGFGLERYDLLEPSPQHMYTAAEPWW